MAQGEYSTFWETVRRVPDPRKVRGKRWALLLAILCAGLASDHKTVWAIAAWARLQEQELRTLLGAGGKALPSPATLYRAVHRVDIEALEAHIAAYGRAHQLPLSVPTLKSPKAPR